MSDDRVYRPPWVLVGGQAGRIAGVRPYSSFMFFVLIVLAIPVVGALVALIRESGKDPRFEGDKLRYRS